MKLSIIIVTWNSADRIERCLRSIKQSDYSNSSEIIVIDNASGDATPDILSSFENIIHTRNTANLGFATANNQGYVQSSGQYVLLLNDDVILEKNTLNELVNYLDNNGSAGGVTCRYHNPDGTIQYGYHRLLPTMGRMIASFFHHYLGITLTSAKNFLMLEDSFDEEKVIEQAACTCLMLRRSAIEKSGGLLDEDLPIYFNDVDLSHRLIKEGQLVWLVPTTAIIHDHGQSTNRLDPYWNKREYYLSLFRYYKKYNRKGDLFVSRLFFIWMLWIVYGLTYAGVLRNYFGTEISDRKRSMAQQRAVIKALTANQPTTHLPQTPINS
ncbi:MAG: glycosyltransferase family 2 protein [Patescibacteria group bacterium]